ncbi:MAG: SPOR domain-containing protein [bacterium]
MKATSPSTRVVFFIPMLIVLPVSVLQAQSSSPPALRKVEKKENQAKQLWEQSRSDTRIERALSLGIKAVRTTSSPHTKARYLSRLIPELMLISDNRRKYFRFLNQQLSKLSSDLLDSSTWLEAARVARHFEHDEKMVEYARQSLRMDPPALEAELLLAAHYLSEGKTSQSRNHLEQYLLKNKSTTDPFYWILRGKLYETSDADSEAYVVYSHLINHYPRSYWLKTAENRIQSLALPKPLYPNYDDSQRIRPLPAEKKTPSPGSSKTGDYRIQVGAFTTRNRAESLKERLMNEISQEVVIIDTVINSKTYYRVRIRGLTEDESQSVLNAIKQKGYGGYVIAPSD